MTQLTEKGFTRGYATGEQGWQHTMNANIERTSAMAFDQWAILRPEPPAVVGLDITVVGGWVMVAGAYVRVADTPLTLPNNVTRYIERNAVGDVFVVAGAFTAVRIPIARVQTAGGAVVDVEDARPHMVGPQGEQGAAGADGDDGADGADGADGVSVVGAHLDGDDLVLELSNATEVNAGDVRGPPGSIDGLDELLDANGTMLSKHGGNLAKVAAGTTGQVLTAVTGEKPVFSALPTLASDVLTTNGDVLTRAAGVLARLGIGTAKQKLEVASGLPAWVSRPALFPDDPLEFGTSTADDEEFEGTLASWTTETALTAPNASVVNGAFSPSRLQVSISNVSGDVLSLYRALALNTSADLSVTFDVGGVFDLDFKSVEVGFRSSTASNAAAMSCAIGHGTDLKMLRRKYTNIGTSSFTDQATETLITGTSGPKKDPRHYLLHLQRVADVWTAWYAARGCGWKRIGGTTTDNFAVTHLWVRIGGFGAAVPYYLAMNFIRCNRFAL